MNYMDQRRQSSRRTFKKTKIRPRPGPKPARPRNHVICIDGTWNYAGQPSPTNVHRLFKMAQGRGGGQIAKYYAGVGSKKENAKAAEILGGATGAGAQFIYNKAYAEFVRDYKTDDRVFIFGFSRGSAMARILSNEIRKRGIPKWLDLYEDRISTTVVYEKSWRKIARPEVHMLGVWDTVGSFGLAKNIGPFKFQKLNLFKNLKVSPNVKFAYHALAADEARDTYAPSPMNARLGIEEVWFPGNHSDVGGGYEDDRRLADEPLRYMAARALRHGLKLAPRRLNAYKPNPHGKGKVHSERIPFIDKIVPRRIRVENPRGAGTPKIHASLAGKLRREKSYRPPNVRRPADTRYEIIES